MASDLALPHHRCSAQPDHGAPDTRPSEQFSNLHADEQSIFALAWRQNPSIPCSVSFTSCNSKFSNNKFAGHLSPTASQKYIGTTSQLADSSRHRTAGPILCFLPITLSQPPRPANNTFLARHHSQCPACQTTGSQLADLTPR